MIPISEYINISSKVLNNNVGERDFSGLVFTSTYMNESVASDYATIYANFNAGKAVQLSLSDVKTLFPEDSDIVAFAEKYFSYVSGSSAPTVLNVASRKSAVILNYKAGIALSKDSYYYYKASTTTQIYKCGDDYTESENTGWDAVSSNMTVQSTDPTIETEKATYDKVVTNGEFGNFGAFAFLGTTTMGVAGGTGIRAVADANAGIGDNVFVYATDTTNHTTDATSLAGIKCCHVVCDVPSDGVNYGAWMPLAWYAAVDYDQANSSSTIDYKEFSGATPTVSSSANKTLYDSEKVNYIGQVQVHGLARSFYQKGYNMDGVLIDIFRDQTWMRAQVENGWFTLAGGAEKIPANADGVNMVFAMVHNVAERGVENGIILVNKTLSATQKALINSYANNQTAADSVEAYGYVVYAKLVQSGSDYSVQYTLIYAKGDHISKVTGSHILV